MKKQILKAFLVLAVVASASTAMATTSIVSTTMIGAGNTFTPSTKVGISVTAINTSYVAGSCHLNGTKEYGTLGGSNLTVAAGKDDTSKIYTKDIPTQATTNTVGVPTPQTSALALQGSGWQ
jgi:hypothetical protein